VNPEIALRILSTDCQTRVPSSVLRSKLKLCREVGKDAIFEEGGVIVVQLWGWMYGAPVSIFPGTSDQMPLPSIPNQR
jgi:hypothetical protein